MIGTVTKIGRAKSGKHIVYFDNKHGQTDGYLVSEKCSVPPERATIDADCNSWDFRGNTFWGLNAWREVKGASNGAVQAPATPVPPQNRLPVVDAPAQALSVWNVDPADLCRFVSNIVGQAVAAGTIKEPLQIRQWTRSAYEAATCMRSGIWNQPGRPDPNEDQDRDPDDEFSDSSIPF